MTEKTDTVTGGCLCGAVRYELQGRLRGVVNCHCGQCRRTHGHFSANTAVKLDQLVLHQLAGLKWFRSSDEARRGFCQQCGASLFWAPMDGNYIAVAAGSLDQPSGLETVAHIHTADLADYYRIDDDLPHHPGGLESVSD